MQDTISTYNGWSNRETWLASLWLTNDPVSYAVLTEAMELEASDFVRAEWLEVHLKDEMYDLSLEASLWNDLLSTSLARVNWLEVIENN
ncbi:MAG TPA: hypothetical protein VNE40_00060 [Candidatus Dormibacteraeota bacterium]|nr:hypothetical protein [Candidatus Dormibacteraeota bacterium]